MVGASENNNSGHRSRFQLADWSVDTASNRLRKGDTEVKLESKVMAVLHYLVQHRGELVTREELEQAVWCDTVVGYDALTRCIARLRKALDDNPREPRYIETIAKKGYRLIARVSDEAPPPDTRERPFTENKTRHRPFTRQAVWLTGSGIILLGLIVFLVFRPSGNPVNPAPQVRTMDRPSIVVLPFDNLSDDPEQSYFSDGITTDITTALSKLSGLFVISQSSATGYRNKPLNVGQIAESLGVNYVLEGSVRRGGNRIRVNVRLIDAGSDIYLWSEQYDRELRDVFQVQDNITDNVVNALSIKLTEEERRRTARKYSASLEAYDDFLKGQALYIRRAQETNNLAREYYQKAIDRDPAFSRAYSALAMTYAAEHRFGWGNVNTGQLDRAMQLAQKGVALDSDLPHAHWVVSYVNLFRHDYDKAAEAANRAIQLDPNYADSYLTLAICRIHDGEPEDALQLARKAMLLNPDYPTPYASVLGQAHYFMEQYDQAVPVLREAVERNINLLTAHVFLIAALSKLDQMDEAGWAAEELKTVAPDFSREAVAGMLPIQDVDTIKDMQRHLQRVGL